MTRIYFDTETTGFPRKGVAPLSDQPHLVQLAALVTDDEAGVIACFNTIIKPDGWEIPEEAAAVHGISTDKAKRFGIPVADAITTFLRFVEMSDQIVAHNIPFDLKIVGFEIARLDLLNPLSDKRQFCTMTASTDLCKLPGRYGSYKWPKLTEAHLHFFGESFDGAHDALADVRACQRVHAHLLSLDAPPPVSAQFAEELPV